MAQGRRTERVASLIRRETSDLLRHGLRDQRLAQAMVSITNVEVTGDLQHCRIFVSVYGNEEEQRLTMAGLQAARAHVRGELGRRLQMRRIPEVSFVQDRGLEKGSSVLSLLSRLEEERQRKEDTTPPEAGGGRDAAAASAVAESISPGPPAPGCTASGSPPSGSMAPGA